MQQNNLTIATKQVIISPINIFTLFLKKMKKIIIILFSLVFVQKTDAQVWQWSTPITTQTNGETNDHPRAFLWIPSDCKQVRGVVLGMHNMLEEGILEHPDFRKSMSDIGFAEIWITPALDMLFDPEKGAQTAFEEVMQSLARISGYSELEFAPVIPIGHSACASFPWNSKRGDSQFLYCRKLKLSTGFAD